MAIEYLDGIRLYRTLTAGLKRVVSRQEYLNKINVFPVPDGDTGTNMAFTLTSIEEGIQNRVYSDIQQMSMAIADSALDGARGNSGAILAQFFVGFADGITNKDHMDFKQFAQAVKAAQKYAYAALIKPQEGTILSVMRDWSHSVEKYSESLGDFRKGLREALREAKISLSHTPEQLSVLAKAGVVDAGAQGFVDMLEGVQDFIESGIIPQGDFTILDPEEAIDVNTTENFRYCTECILIGEDIPRRTLQERLSDIGDSVVLAGMKSKAKVHIHTDAPQKVFSLCSEYGQVKGQKTDDMIKQQQDARQEHDSIAVIVDSACDLPEEMLEKYNIHMIPARLNFGNTHYVDKVSLNSDEFWKEMETNPIHPHTSQPSPGDFRRQYQFLSSHYESAVSIHVPEAVSGTYQSAITASKNIKEFPLHVVDSGNGSVGNGLIAIRAAEAIKAGKTFEQVQSIIEQAINNTQIFIGLESLDSVVKGGRVPPIVRTIANFLGLNPVLTFTRSGVKPFAKTFGKKNKGKKFIKLVEKHIPKKQPFRIAIAHAKVENLAIDWREDLVKNSGADKVILTEIGPALGVHAGRGALVSAIQTLDDDLNDE